MKRVFVFPGQGSQAVGMGRALAEEFGEACAFLCSAQAGYIVGQNLLLDGGAFRSSI